MKIISEWYLNAGDSMPFIGDGKEYLHQPPQSQPPVDRDHDLRRVTVCFLVLDNGYVVTGTSACEDLSNFNRTLGEWLAKENALLHMNPIVGYEMRSNFQKDKDENRN